MDLFAPLLPEGRLHPQFRDLQRSPVHDGVRRLMNDLFDEMGDCTGRFPADFQSEGFHSRVFELACFAYLREAALPVEKGYTKPDFITPVAAIEVTASNPSANAPRDISVLRMERENIGRATADFRRRTMSVLRRKVSRHYDRLPHCVGKPLVLYVAPFFAPGSVYEVDEALVDVLYGSPEGPTRGTSLPLFLDTSVSAVSAVAFCNQFTVPRFFRLGPPTGHIERLSVWRQGIALDRVGEKMDLAILSYGYDPNDPTAPPEKWAQGVTIFHNPVAKIALPIGALPCTSFFTVEDGSVRREVIGLHTVTSFMLVHGDADEEPEETDPPFPRRAR